MTFIAYSGGGDPLIKAINQKLEWDARTIILLGAPLKPYRKIINLNTERVIMIRGEWDFVSEMGGGCALQDFEGSANELDTYKIMLKGVDHLDYTYDPADRDPDSTKVKAARFIAEMTKLGTNASDLTTFMTEQMNWGSVTYEPTLKIYKVDLDKVVYNYD